MTSSGIAESALRQVVERAREHDSHSRVFAVKAESYDGKASLVLGGGEHARVHWCPSVLEFRQRLVEAADETVVLVTPCDEHELGEDAISQLARGRLESLGEWEPIRALFKARAIPQQVTSQKWLARSLLQNVPRDGYEPAPSGVLTYDHALSSLSRAVLGVAEPTAAGLLMAVTTSSRRFADHEQTQLARALGKFHSQRLGPFCAAIFAAASAGHAAHAVALGLAAQVVFAPDSSGGLEQEQRDAIVRLERFTGGEGVSAEAGRGWASAAERVLAEVSADDARTWTADAERLLSELRITELIVRSEALPGGLSARRAAAVTALGEWLAEESEGRRAQALIALTAVSRHRLATPKGVRGLEMTARLIQFAHSAEPAPPISLAESASRYVREGGPLDRCREALDGEFLNGAEKQLSNAVAAAVDPRRERRAEDFARLLAAAMTADRDDGLLLVERVQAELVEPIARAVPLLVIVLDGMSEAAFQSIAPSIAEIGWTQVTANGKERVPTLAALPSLTSVSRASLLSGSLSSGSQRVENAGFEEALRGVGSAQLFHRAELSAGDELRDVISGGAVRIVGVVLNAIDDMLDKGDQVAGEWTLDRIGPLRGLLDAAAESGRAVVLASDHGHVIERGSEHRACAQGGARWRPVETGDAGEGEVLLEGRRVLMGGGSVIAPAVERLRYRSKSSGYHGGATPQEVIAPVAAFLPAGMEVPGFSEALSSMPAWWDLGAAARVPSPDAKPSRPAGRSQEQLFEAWAPEDAREPGWIERLLASGQYASQVEQALRPPSDERIARTLEQLDRRGGVAAVEVISQTLEVPPSRGRTVISSMQQVLNVDGYGILTLDAASNEVRLNRPLLETQFGL